MLSWILLLVVLAAVVVLGTWFWGTVFGRGEVLDPIDEPATLVDDNRAAVAEGRPEDVRFEMVTRGYRPEQVDAVIDEFTHRLEQARSGPDAQSARRADEKVD